MELVEKISNELGLTFMTENEQRGNVCLADSAELRPEFKETFTSTDVLHFKYAVLKSTTNQEENNDFSILNSVPKDRRIFWELVELGNKIRPIQ